MGCCCCSESKEPSFCFHQSQITEVSVMQKKKCCYNIYYALISSWRKDNCNYLERNWPFKLHKGWVIQIISHKT